MRICDMILFLEWKHVKNVSWVASMSMSINHLNNSFQKKLCLLTVPEYVFYTIYFHITEITETRFS